MSIDNLSLAHTCWNCKYHTDIRWNFTKFIIDREGNVVARFEPTTDMAKVEEFVKGLL